MIKVAVVDDEAASIARLKDGICRFAREYGEDIEVTSFTNGVNFISEYGSDCDIIFMDIEMPHLDGMETAKLLRAADSRVALVFVTNLANYAIKGYEVDAADFIVKPLTDEKLFPKLQKILPRVKSERSEPYVKVNTRLCLAKVYLSDIYYITVSGRYVMLHTKDGEIELRKSMKETEKLFAEHGFVRCDNSAMLNLKYVSALTKDGAVVNGTTVAVSRNRKKAVLDAFTLYLR